MSRFLSSPLWGLLGLGLTLVFGTISILQYIKSRRFKQILYTCIFSKIQTRDHPDVSIFFKGKEITNLWRLLVVCWNGGTSEIRKSDIPSGEPPYISFADDARVLSFKLLGQSSSGVGFTID